MTNEVRKNLEKAIASRSDGALQIALHSAGFTPSITGSKENDINFMVAVAENMLRMEDSNPVTERDRWCRDREKEFEFIRQTEPAVKCVTDAARSGEVTMEMALKVACIELARIKNGYREHVNISELNKPVVIQIPSNAQDSLRATETAPGTEK